MNCDTCDKKKSQADPVPFQAHEADMARMERTNKRQTYCIAFLVVLCIVLGALLYAMHLKSERALIESENALVENNRRWIEMWSEYDFESYEYQQDGEGVNIIGNMNGVEYNGADGESPASDAEER